MAQKGVCLCVCVNVCGGYVCAAAGGIMMFAVKKEKCMGCKTLISEKVWICLACILYSCVCGHMCCHGCNVCVCM